MNLRTNEPLAVAVVEAIHTGDVESLQRLLQDNAGLATARLGKPDESNGMSRTLLHVATDWPGHFPNGAATVAALIAAGADVNARFTGPHRETLDQINHAGWYACHGGQQRPAEYFLERGAELNWIPGWERRTPLDAARRSDADAVVEWLRSQGAKSAKDLK